MSSVSVSSAVSSVSSVVAVVALALASAAVVVVVVVVAVVMVGEGVAMVWRDTASRTRSVAYSSSPRGKRCKPHPKHMRGCWSRRSSPTHLLRASPVRLRLPSRSRSRS